jgi:hypothetical protein
MPVYVPHYKNDIFISYTPIDDEPLTGADKGWVTTLINGLKTLLRQKLGRADAYSLWMDYELRGHESVTPMIVEQLQNSAILLLILSPGYLVSQRCRYELNTFLTIVGKNAGRVFIVERDEVLRPEEFSDLLGYKFWITNDTGKPRTLGVPKPNPEEFEYYQRLNDVACQLTDKLNFLKTEVEKYQAVVSVSTAKLSTTVAATVATSSPTLFLAEVTADLETQRNEVKRYFDQQGVRILPDKVYPFTKIQQYLDQDLKNSQFFIQLLSNQMGNGYPQFQHERALATQLPIFQWRDSLLDPATVTDPDYRALLESSTVIASNLVEFQTYILNQLKPKRENTPPANPVGDLLVFINAAPEDMLLANEIKDILETHGIGYSLPLEPSTNTKAAEIRQYLEQNLLYSDAVLVLYDNTSIVWVTEQLFYLRRIQGRREQPLKMIAVYNKPLPGKTSLPLKFPNLRLLECPTPQNATCLPSFIRALQP